MVKSRKMTKKYKGGNIAHSFIKSKDGATEALNNAQETLKKVSGSSQSGGKKKGCGCSSPVQLGGKKTRRNRKIKGGQQDVVSPPVSDESPSLFGKLTEFAKNAGNSIQQGYESTKNAVSNKFKKKVPEEHEENTTAQNAASAGNFNDAQQTPLTVGGRKRKSKKHRKKSRKHRKKSKKHRKRSKKSRR